MKPLNIAIGIASFLVGTHAFAQVHITDIILRNNNGAIETGIVDTAGVVHYGERIFLGAFGELPNWTNDPGFDSEPGSLPPGLTLHIDIVDAAREWDGIAFVTIPEERIAVTKSGSTITSPVVAQTVAGPVLGSANGAGVFHHHAAYELLAPADTGVYLLALQLRDQAGTLATSDTFWIVFNQNENPQVHLEAAQWVRTNLATPCYADCDGNTTINVFDYICFGNLYANADPGADCDGNGAFNVFDYICFGNAYAAGCR